MPLGTVSARMPSNNSQARKMIHSLLNISAARSYVPYQMLENKQMLYEILHEPEKVLDHVRRYTNSLTTSMTFG